MYTRFGRIRITGFREPPIEPEAQETLRGCVQGDIDVVQVLCVQQVTVTAATCTI